MTDRDQLSTRDTLIAADLGQAHDQVQEARTVLRLLVGAMPELAGRELLRIDQMAGDAERILERILDLLLEDTAERQGW